jgi:GNAT superfamily N-acetyltransferase
MWWRLKRSEFDRQRGAENCQAFQDIVIAGPPPGILAYHDALPIGWCCIAPREEFPALERSRILKRVDDQPVWSVVCFFIQKTYRHQGLTAALIQAAVQYATEQGARIVEGYPEEPLQGSAPDPFVFTGLASSFRKAGFIEVLRRSEKRPIMRFYINPAQEQRKEA